MKACFFTLSIAMLCFSPGAAASSLYKIPLMSGIKTDTVFPPYIVGGVWTDLIRIVVGTKTPDGFKNMGLLNWEGDTVLPCQYLEVSPAGSDHFFVVDTSGKSGVANGKGIFVVPLEEGRIIRKGKVFVRLGSLYQNKVYGFDGKLLLDSVGYRNVEPYNTYPEHHAERYFLVSTKEPNSTGLFSDAGTLILPMRFAHIVYITDRHLLAAKTGDALELYDFNGTHVIPDRFFPLGYTPDPTLMFGEKEGTGKWGFIHVNEPWKNKFEYDEIKYGGFGTCFLVREAGANYLHGADGKRLNPKPLPAVEQPRSWHRLYWKTQHLPENLVAVQFTSNEPGSIWYGFGDKGSVHKFKTPADGWGEFLKLQPTTEEMLEKN